jgi:hypothetical protein
VLYKESGGSLFYFGELVKSGPGRVDGGVPRAAPYALVGHGPDHVAVRLDLRGHQASMNDDTRIQADSTLLPWCFHLASNSLDRASKSMY